MSRRFFEKRFGKFPADWKTAKLKDVCELIADGTHFSPKSKGGPYKYVTSKNISFGKIDFTDVDYISEEEHNEIYRGCPVQQGDLLLTKDGANTGNAAINPISEPFSLLSSVALIRARKDVSTDEYLLQFILSPLGQSLIKAEMTGQAITRLTLTKISNFEFFFPPLPEQRNIAAILSTWDEAIALTEQLIAALQERKKGLMQRLLTGEVRFPGFVQSDKMQETKFGPIPVDWEYVPILEIARQVSKKNDGGEDLTVLSCTKYDGLVDSLEYFGRQIFSDDTSTYKVVKRGQFAYATNHVEEGSIGYQDKYDRALISPMYTVFQTNKRINDSYLYKVLKTELYRHIFEINTSASVNRRGSLRWNVFSQIKIPLPSLKEQKAIAQVIELNEEQISIAQKQLESQQQQKKGLMQYLLTGEVRVRV